MDANLGPADEVSVASLLLIHPNGQQKRWRIKTFYQRAPENNMGAVLLRFLEPNDLNGMTLVSINQPAGENYQWLYLPAFRNPKILSESGKSDYVFGSDLTYEDFVPFVLDDYAFETIREENLEGRPAQVIRVTPTAETIKSRAAYDHQLLWVDTERLVLLRADYFDTLGRLFKTSTWSDFYRPDGRHWRARRRAVFSPLRPHWTEMTFEDVQINRNLPVDFFTEENVTSLR
ncbi:outer membrane lipoprotein-sorting protein [bacterium]|nr:outer membrane lipoprotein-sorting protein [bacterium]